MPNIKTVLVTGASGKLGGPLCQALVAEGYHVLAARHRLPVDVEGVEEVAMDVSDAKAVEAAVARSDAILHLATCKEDGSALIKVSLQGTFNLLEATVRTGRPKRFVLASGDAVNGIYFNRQPAPIDEKLPMVAYPGYYPLSKVLEETMCQQYFYQAKVPTVCLRMSWIHAEDDILNHLTTAGECFGIPVWSELMNDRQRAKYADGRDAAVALRSPDGKAMLRHIVAVEDCVQSFLLSLTAEGIEGETFMIAMNDPLNYVDAAAHTAKQLDIDTIELVDPVGKDFCIDTTKARYVLGYRPKHDIFSLIDQAVGFRRSGGKRRLRSGFKG